MPLIIVFVRSFVRSRVITRVSLVVTAVKGVSLQPGDSNKATKEPGTISTRRKLGEFFAIKMPTLQAVMSIADESVFSDAYQASSLLTRSSGVRGFLRFMTACWNAVGIRSQIS